MTRSPLLRTPDHCLPRTKNAAQPPTPPHTREGFVKPVPDGVGAQNRCPRCPPPSAPETGAPPRPSALPPTRRARGRLRSCHGACPSHAQQHTPLPLLQPLLPPRRPVPSLVRRGPACGRGQPAPG